MSRCLINNEKITSFEENGFVTLADVISADELAKLRETCINLLDSAAGREEGDQFDLAGNSADMSKAKLPQIMNPSKYAPALRDLKYRQEARVIAQQLLGESVEQVNEHFIIKPSFCGSETPWHQDQAYHDPALRYNSTNVWLALSDATLDNGCMQYVPGSHHMDVLPHHNIGHDPTTAGLEVDDPGQYSERAVACPVQAGCAVIHRSYVLHYAGPNSTENPRLAYVLVFGCEPRPREKPLDFPWLTAHHEGSRSTTDKD